MTGEDLTGLKFGKLLVIGEADPYIRPGKRMNSRYHCVCTCGKVVVVRADNLKNGHSLSCGSCQKSFYQYRPNKKPKPYDSCCFIPKGVNCSDSFCDKCGWNPHNKELRNRRIAKIKRKDGTNE